MNGTLKRVAVGAAAVMAAAMMVGSPAHAVAADEAPPTDRFCAVQAGHAPKCASTEADMRAMVGSTALTHVVTLWEHPNYTGTRDRVFAPECDAESDFAPADYSYDFIWVNGKRWVSSVNKIDAGHCNWVLVGPNGGRSTEVAGDWPRLSELGDGWDNRAVRILLD